MGGGALAGWFGCFWVFWVWACAAVCFGFGLVPGVGWCDIVWVGAGFGVAGLADLWFGGVALC